MSLSTNCPLCGSTDFETFFTLPRVPVICNQLWPNDAAARAAPTGAIDLAVCRSCACIWNSAFDPERMRYAPGYENALHFSPTFRAFADELAADLVDRFDLKGRTVIDIGCGDGHMLDLLSRHGAAEAVGFDPSMEGVTSPFTEREGVEIVPEYFRSEQLDRPFDAIVCRHVLEHLDEPLAFLKDIRAAIGDRDVPVYIEVPNARWMLDASSMWDVIYEHVGYWTEPSLVTLFRRAGFEPTQVREGYGQQFLMIEARPGTADPYYLHPDTRSVLRLASAFGEFARTDLKVWRSRIGALEGRAVIWGAGSKGISFANALHLSGQEIAAFVDLNERKQGLVAPGVGVPIVAPDALGEIAPSLVLISNAQYLDEITAQTRGMGLDPAFAVVTG